MTKPKALPCNQDQPIKNPFPITYKRPRDNKINLDVPPNNFDNAPHNMNSRIRGTRKTFYVKHPLMNKIAPLKRKVCYERWPYNSYFKYKTM
jgi:hypothetical protein